MIIGLTGLSGAGKDTVANWLVDNKGFERRAFADPLKNLLYGLNPSVRTRENVSLKLREIIDREGSWDRAKLVHPEIRNLLQKFGADFIRDQIDPDFWVKLGMYDVDSNANLVFSDVRFLNEADAIRKAGGTIVNVHSSMAELRRMKHVSENVSLDYDVQIVNDGTLSELFDCLFVEFESIGCSAES